MLNFMSTSVTYQYYNFSTPADDGNCTVITFRNARITYKRVWPSFPYFSKNGKTQLMTSSLYIAI